MKFKTTIVLFSVLVVLLVFVFFFEEKVKKPEEIEEKLVELDSNEIQKITLKKENETITFKKDEKEDWLIIEPLEVKADKFEVDQLANDFSDLKIERIVEEDPADISQYEIPQKEIILWSKEKDTPLKILVGMENPLDSTFFAKREDEKRIVLIPGSLKNILEKKVFDFRQKDIFTLETENIKTIKLRAKETIWEAEKKEEEWWFNKPFKALADVSKVENISGTLSRMKAKEFVSEEKTSMEISKYSLNRPDYEIILGQPSENKEITFFLHKKDEKVFATTSLSTKIVEVEDTVLTELEKEAGELRKKDVVEFYTWEVYKVRLRKEDMDITVIKDKEDNWHFETGEKEEANKEKITTFARKIESLEAEEFIDPPLELKDHELDKPQVEVTIWTKGDDESEEKAKEYKIQIGLENKAVKKVIVRNPRLDYLFKVDSEFLGQLPQDAKDWKIEKEEEKK